MHLKNFSLITQGEKTNLSPAYDLLNTAIVFHSKDEIALSLHGKMRNLKKSDFIDYFALQQLALNQTIITQIFAEFKQTLPKWEHQIGISFLSKSMQKKYAQLAAQRSQILGL